MNIPEVTRIAISNLEETVLHVLFKARKQGNEYLSGADIGRAMEIYWEWPKSTWLYCSILYKLEYEKRIKAQPSKRGKRRAGWRLTDAEYDRLKIEMEKSSSDDKRDGVVEGTKVPSVGGKEPESPSEEPVQGTTILPSRCDT
ncbi:hypothetical protein C6503_19320 [Candidatus Poribacteria bacterium]|nr:MAG: hypothetical protein C6503_19320 [Candidatus Poribacteria bacterium]